LFCGKFTITLNGVVSMTGKIKIPVTFNPMKHHLNFIISEAEKLKFSSMDEISDKLLVVGDNLMDLYTGKLSVDEILSEIQSVLNNLNVFTREDFCSWISGSDYKKLILSDSSAWVVKLSANDENYIHLHPGKRSEFTCRVRGSTLKTVVACFADGKLPEKQHQLNEVNEIRCNWLNLPPVKTLQPGKGILKLAAVFMNHAVNCYPAAEAY
jgi:hypothetical protein